MKRFDNAVTGDRVYSRLQGFGKITYINLKDGYPIGVLFDSGAQNTFTIEGHAQKSNVEPVLFYVDGDNKYCEVRPILTIDARYLPVDTKLMVGDRKNRNAHRHFACIKESIINCFSDGTTSWSCNNPLAIMPWPYVELGEKITHDNVTYPIGTKVVVK